MTMTVVQEKGTDEDFQRIVRYLDELMEVMEVKLAMQAIGGGDGCAAEAAKLLLESSPGAMGASQVGMQETLEDKQKKLQREQTVLALRLKHTAEIEEQAQKLIKEEVKAATWYSPEEITELEKRLRCFKPQKESQSAVAEEQKRAVAEKLQSVVAEWPQSEVAQGSQVSEDTVSPCERPKKIRSAWIEENELKGVSMEAAPGATPHKVSSCDRPRRIRSAWIEENELKGVKIEAAPGAMPQKVSSCERPRRIRSAWIEENELKGVNVEATPEAMSQKVSSCERPRRIRSAWIEENELKGAGVEAAPEATPHKVSSCDRPRRIRSAWIEENELNGVKIEAAQEASPQKIGDASNEREFQEAASSKKKAHQRSSCWQGCFAGLIK